jgi:hypothetical protein
MFLRKNVVEAKFFHTFTFRPCSNWWGGGNSNRLQQEESGEREKRHDGHAGVCFAVLLGLCTSILLWYDYECV